MDLPGFHSPLVRCPPHYWGLANQLAMGGGHHVGEIRHSAEDADPSENLEAIEAIVPPHLSKGFFRLPDKLITSLCSEQNRNGE